MSLKIFKSAGNFAEGTPGAHFVGLQSIVVAGMHPGFNGGENVKKIVLTYEGRENGSPFQVSEVANVSFHEKSTLLSRVIALNGGKEPENGMEIASLLGRGCLITLAQKAAHDGRLRNKIAQVSPLPPGTEPPAISGELIYFDADEHANDPEAFAKLNPLARKMVENRIHQNTGADAPTPFDEDDDIPFDI